MKEDWNIRHISVSTHPVGPVRDGGTEGVYDPIPERNTMSYDVEFDDGMVKEYSANVIAEELFNQTDDEGFTVTHFD
eukprot:scaffold196_cov113-Cylindrotheca_fusiformis.AAC.4